MIALLNPQSARWKHRIPLSIFSLGAVLEGRHSYELIDGNIDHDVRATLMKAVRDRRVRYLGVTVMPGPQLAEAINLTQELKNAHPGLTVIWGGYFPTLHTGVVLNSGIVDYVIRGEGEWSFAELIDALEAHKPIDMVPNLSYRRDGRVVHNPKRHGTDPNELPPLPYHRINVERYLTKTILGSRTAVYHSSYGCPFLCGFCAVAGVYKGRWIGRDAAAVVNDVLALRDRYRINAIEFIDNNFFVAEKRTFDIAEGLCGQGIAWWGEARPDTVMHYGDATWRQMGESGCRMMFFGVESSSDAVLKLMDKGGTQTPRMVLDLARRMHAFGIIPEFSFVLGAPSEDVGRDIDRDIEYIRRIKEINPAAEIIIYVYSPVSFEDAALFQKAQEYGFAFPQKLTDWLKPEWTKFDLRKDPRTPWLKQEHIERIMNFERVLNARYPTISDIKLKAWQVATLKTLGSWRYLTRFYKAPYEIRFVANRLFKYRQPEIEGF
jgi:anaerobic magnesium-protoporphyrin IX monomethyl ester cyclase